jgi:hypothetical protein
VTVEDEVEAKPRFAVGYVHENPRDLITLRQAEIECGVSHHTLREWISNCKKDGAKGKRLATYHEKERIDVTLVSRAAVIRLRDMKVRKPRGESATTHRAELPVGALDRLVKLMTKRLGFAVTGKFALNEAVAAAVRNEEARAAR